MPSDLVFLGFGFALLISGGHALVNGASSLAVRLGVAPIVIGLTVVAFGTSTPELVVNVAAALRGDTEIGFGNVVGSNIANVGLLLALTAIVTPLMVDRTLLVRDVPMMILTGSAVLVLGGGGLIEDSGSGFGRGDGLMLLMLFAVFLYYTVGEALRHRGSPPSARGGDAIDRLPGTRRTVGLIMVGLSALVIGGEITLRGAVGLSQALGLSEVVIGLTIMAVGTSLPELATTLSAALRGRGDLAFGNIVGSNIFNLSFIWGLSVVIEPAAMPAGGMVDLLVMTGLSVMLLPMAVSRNRLGRIEGAILLLVYAAYVVWLSLRG